MAPCMSPCMAGRRKLGQDHLVRCIGVKLDHGPRVAGLAIKIRKEDQTKRAKPRRLGFTGCAAGAGHRAPAPGPATSLACETTGSWDTRSKNADRASTTPSCRTRDGARLNRNPPTPMTVSK